MSAVSILLDVKILMMPYIAENYLMEILKSVYILLMLVTLLDQTLQSIKKPKIDAQQSI